MMRRSPDDLPNAVGVIALLMAFHLLLEIGKFIQGFK